MTRPVDESAFVLGLEDWLQSRSANGDAWAMPLRRRAHERFLAAGLPRSHQEDWRHLPLNPLTRTTRPVLDAPGALDASALGQFAIAGLDAVRIVLVDGFLVPELSDLGALPDGLDVLEIHEAMSGERELLEADLEHAGSELATSLEALNAAWCRGGVVLRARSRAAIERPVHLLCISTLQPQPSITHPRVVIRGERSSQWSIVEDHVCLAGSTEFVNLVASIDLAPDARLDHVKLVRTGPSHLHVSSTRARLRRDARLHSVGASVDGEIVRQDIRAYLLESNTEITLNGLVVLDRAQVVDNHSWIHHAAKNTRSRQHYRNVLDGTARAVFAGRVVVEEGASGTDAQQSNANLLLSDTARIDTLPQLEIYNDDVKASHGATLGQLDRDGLFYLRSRGIDERAARGLLTFAFANTVVETIGIAAVRDFLRSQVFEHLPQLDLSEELV